MNDGELDDSDTENVDGDVNQNNEKVLSIPKDFDSTEFRPLRTVSGNDNGRKTRVD